jgi:metal-responsive CopG/Arc/MetJ family transcriptional regulator
MQKETTKETIRMSLDLPTKTVQELKLEAKKLGISNSAVIRLAIYDYLQKQK